MQKINRVDSLDAGCQQIPCFQNFWNFHNVVMEHQLFKISEKKSKKYFFNKTFPKIQFTIEIA